MTIIDMFLLLPLWARIIIAIPLIIWAIEAFLLPFKFNVWYHKYKDATDLLKAILDVSKANTKEFEDTQRIVSLLLGLLGAQSKTKDDKQQDR